MTSEQADLIIAELTTINSRLDTGLMLDPGLIVFGVAFAALWLIFSH